MKKFLSAILTMAAVSFCSPTQAQKTNDQEVYKIPADKKPDSFFLDKRFCNKYSLDFKSKDNLMRVWYNNRSKDSIQMLFDIRYWCKTEDDAKKYLTDHLLELSEDGVPNKDNITVKGASDLHVYHESEKTRQTIEGMKLNYKQINFIFRLKNVVLKVFVACNKRYTSQQLQVFAQEAADRVDRALK